MAKKRSSVTRVLAAFLVVSGTGCLGQIAEDQGAERPKPGVAGVGPAGSGPASARPGASAPQAPGAAPAPGGAQVGQPAPAVVPEPVNTAAPPRLAPLVCKPDLRLASPARIWRLSAAQYAATARTLVATFDPATVSNPFGVVTGSGRFSNEADSGGMPELAADQLLRASEQAAPRAVTDLKRTLPCLQMPAVAADCVRDALARFGRRAFRRPLTSDEVTPYADAVGAPVAAAALDAALGLALEAMLSSPSAVFRTELGAGPPDAAARLRLTPHELASALSYTVSDGPPDPILAVAADEGRLTTTEDLRAQALRLWGTPGASQVFDRFAKEYFQYPLATTVFKASITPVHRPAMLVTDTASFVLDLFDKRKGFLRNLLMSGSGFVEAGTAGTYGLAPPAGGTAKQRIDFPAGQRFGILTQPSFLAALSHNDANDPIKRGRFVRESLLCQPVPAIPIGVVPVLPELGPNATMREKLVAHNQDSCAGCHALMDPIGFTLEQYDHYGQYRTAESGRPVDTTGTLAGVGPAPLALAGPKDLTSFLADAPQVRECFARHAFRFLVGRNEGAADDCALQATMAALGNPDGDVVAALTAMLSSESFLYRARPVATKP